MSRLDQGCEKPTRGTCPTAVGARGRLISLREVAEAVPCLSWHLSQITQGSSNPRQGRRLRHLNDVVGVASKRLQTYGCVGRKTEVNHGYRDHFNSSLVIVRRWRGTLLGDGRWMGNRPHRINYCRSRDRVSLEWLSRKARPAPLIFAPR